MICIKFLDNNNAEMYFRGGKRKIDDCFMRFKNELTDVNLDDMLCSNFNIARLREECCEDMFDRLKILDLNVGKIKTV